jgi:hypothetical protein
LGVLRLDCCAPPDIRAMPMTSADISLLSVIAMIEAALLIIAMGHQWGHPPVVDLSFECPDEFHGVYADIRDGDRKDVFILGDVVTIKPGDVGPGDGPKTWTATGKLDRTTCSASIDFRVPGKTRPPPVALNATFWKSYSGDWSRTNIEFTDPSGNVGKKDIPLNRWVEVTTQPSTQSIPCPSGLHHTADVFADIKNDDVKVVGLNSADLRIEQADVAKKIEWGVSSQLDAESCSAIVDFHGRFGSDKLTATLLQSKSMSSLK